VYASDRLARVARLACLAVLLLTTTRVRADASGGKPVADDTTAPIKTYTVDAFVRIRFLQSWVSISPRLRSLVEHDLPDSTVSAAALRTIVDTARSNDGLTPTRADTSLEYRASPSLAGELRVDWARLLSSDEAGHAVRELSASWSPVPALSVSAGIFALPFSLHELFEERGFELTDEGPSHHLLEHLGYDGRDVGAMLTVRPLPRGLLSLDLAATEGGALGAQDYRGPGLLSGRLRTQPMAELEVTTAVSFRPRPLDAWWEELRYRYRAYDQGAAVATNAALLLQRWTARVEWMAGERTDNDIPVPLALRRGDARTFAAVWAMVTAHRSLLGVGLVPSVRAEWLDADLDHGDVGELIQVSLGLALDLDEHVRVTGELTRRVVQPGTRDFTFDLLRYRPDVTSAALQLQLGM
jgi:hypothetical protein